MILKYTIIYITMKEFQNAQPCLLSNYFTGKGQVNIDGELVVFGYCCDDEITSQGTSFKGILNTWYI